jgi:undecaprenyl-diphosphatase
MSVWEAILLGVVQGVTEFLPVSSSGHLVLAQHFLNVSEEGSDKGQALFFDGVLHFGTMVAVLLYFRSGLRQQLRQHLAGGGGPGGVEAERVWPASWGELFRLGILVGLATLPAFLAVVLRSEQIKESFNNPTMVAVNFLILGAILILVSRLPSGPTVGPATTWWQALLIGVGQACSALFRGLSRSGMTISTALLVGLERTWAVRFSFMMSVVASAGLGGLGILKALRDPTASQWLTAEFLGLTLLGMVVSGVVGYLTIAPLIRLVRHAHLWWFAVYLWAVGAAVLLFKPPATDKGGTPQGPARTATARGTAPHAARAPGGSPSGPSSGSRPSSPTAPSPAPPPPAPGGSRAGNAPATGDRP